LQAAHVCFIHCDTVLEGVFLRTFENAVLLDLRVVESILEMLAAVVGKKVLSRRELGWEGFCLAVEPGSVGKVVLLVERAGVVIAKLVIIHD
jgi:hypothetical protein